MIKIRLRHVSTQKTKIDCSVSSQVCFDAVDCAVLPRHVCHQNDVAGAPTVLSVISDSFKFTVNTTYSNLPVYITSASPSFDNLHTYHHGFQSDQVRQLWQR